MQQVKEVKLFKYILVIIDYFVQLSQHLMYNYDLSDCPNYSH